MNSKRIGIIGGGQLGMMLLEEAQRYKVEAYTLDPEEQSSAQPLSSKHFCGSLKDKEAILKMAADVDVVTFEIEHINVEALKELEAMGKKVIPASSVLEIIQDKGLQKKFYQANQIPTAPFVIVEQPDQWIDAIQQLNCEKFAAKLCKEGYDGKGVVLCDSKKISSGEQAIPFETQCVLEAFIDEAKEISIIVARDQHGQNTCYPAVEMEFDPVANLVTYLFSPADIDQSLEQQAQQIALRVVEKMNGIGTFAIEMFVDANQNIWVNETAPRAHNSGHHTIEACYTSQYEQLLRVLLDKPLGSTKMITPAAMLNVLGNANFSGTYYLKGEEKLLQQEGIYIHMYGKKISKPNRKLGHITIIGETLAEVKEKAKFVLENFSIESDEQ